MLSLKVVNASGEVLGSSEGNDEVILVYKDIYREGDKVVLTLDKKDKFIIWQVDDALGEAFVFMTGTTAEYLIPFGEKKISYSPKVFTGEVHYLCARVAKKFEIESYRNLAINVADQHSLTECYPHVTANVETRGEAVFAARNAIDGVKANSYHGIWPFESWGINQQDDAEMKLDFGRMVSIDQIALYTRADFPHDNWWKQATIEFSDGSKEVLTMEKSNLAHTFSIKERRVSWLVLKELIKADDPSPFPALTQIEVYGRDII